MNVITFVFAMFLMIGFFTASIRLISIMTEIRDIFYMEFTQKFPLDKIDKFKERSKQWKQN